MLESVAWTQPKSKENWRPTVQMRSGHYQKFWVQILRWNFKLRPPVACYWNLKSCQTCNCYCNYVIGIAICTAYVKTISVGGLAVSDKNSVVNAQGYWFNWKLGFYKNSLLIILQLSKLISSRKRWHQGMAWSGLWTKAFYNLTISYY